MGSERILNPGDGNVSLSCLLHSPLTQMDKVELIAVLAAPDLLIVLVLLDPDLLLLVVRRLLPSDNLVKVLLGLENLLHRQRALRRQAPGVGLVRGEHAPVLEPPPRGCPHQGILARTILRDVPPTASALGECLHMSCPADGGMITAHLDARGGGSLE